MAEQLKLVRTYDFEADQDSVSLISNTDGFDVAYQGWTPNVTPDRTGKVQEALTLRVQGTSTDAIAASLQKLADKAEEVIRYQQNGARDYAVWFRVQMNGETKGRQTLVHELRHEPASSVYDYALRQSFHWNEYSLGITRAPWWEGTACGTVTIGTINTCGGTSLYSGTINGDLDTRWAQVKITNMGTSQIFPQGEMWLGYKSNRFGSVGSFVPYISLGGTIADPYWRVGGTAASTADATAKGGTSRYYNGGTSGQYFMEGIPLRCLTTQPDIYRGDYRVLLRAKLSGTAQYLVQLQTGWLADYTFIRNGEPGDLVYPNAKSYPRVSIAHSTVDTKSRDYYSTNWHFYDLGEITIPPMTHFRSQVNLDYYTFLLYAEWFSGTGDLWMDGYVLVPLDGFLYSGYSPHPALIDGTALYAIQSPEGIMQAATKSIATSPSATVDVWGGINIPLFKGGCPPGTTGLFVAAAHNFVESLKNIDVAVEIKYFERWKEMRGND